MVSLLSVQALGGGLYTSVVSCLAFVALHGTLGMMTNAFSSISDVYNTMVGPNEENVDVFGWPNSPKVSPAHFFLLAALFLPLACFHFV